ncbi:MAG: hypothetical protein ACOC2H_02130, partial [Spirochaetota bacterium]
MKKNRRIIFNIGLKLIVIISVIFAVSFAIMIYIATDLFKNDMTSFIENNNHRISSSAAQSLEIYIRNIIEKSYIAADELSRNAASSVPVTEETVSDSLASLFLSSSNDIFYLAIVERTDAPSGTGEEPDIRIRKNVYNQNFFTMNELDYGSLPETVASLSGEITEGLRLHVRVFNASPHFSYPVTGLIIPYQALDENTAKSVLVLFIKTDVLRNIVHSTDITTTYIISEDGTILVHPDLKQVLNSQDVVKLPIYQDFHTNALDNGQKHFTENGDAKIGSYQRINFAGFSLGVITTVDE